MQILFLIHNIIYQISIQKPQVCISRDLAASTWAIRPFTDGPVGGDGGFGGESHYFREEGWFHQSFCYL